MKATYQLIGLPTKNVPEPAHNLSAIYWQAQLEWKKIDANLGGFPCGEQNKKFKKGIKSQKVVGICMLGGYMERVYIKKIYLYHVCTLNIYNI